MQMHGNDVRNMINARRMANAHGMFVVEMSDCFLLYRKQLNNRGIYLGKRTTTKKLLALVEACSTTQKDAQP